MSAPTTGFFVDWNGMTRRIESPGRGYTCGPVREQMCGGRPFLAVDVLDSAGFVVHAAVFYPTLQSLRAIGVTIEMYEEPQASSSMAA